MKTSTAFKKTIQDYLEKRAEEDPLFVETYKKENKTIEECCNYVIKRAKDGGCAGYSDEEVFGWAVHYYDEDDIKDIKPISGKVVVNHTVELTEEDKAEAKRKAMEIVTQEAKEEAKKQLSETIKLTDDDIADARKLAMEKAVEEQKEKLVKKKTAKKVEAVTEVEQDLFSM